MQITGHIFFINPFVYNWTKRSYSLEQLIKEIRHKQKRNKVVFFMSIFVLKVIIMEGLLLKREAPQYFHSFILTNHVFMRPFVR
jgi:uncharacterized membrane protein